MGKGKSRVQQIVIYYRFVGCIEIPDAPQIVHALDTIQGVRVSYETIAVKRKRAEKLLINNAILRKLKQKSIEYS